MHDYYDPHPRLLIADPILLVGHVGAGVAFVARAMAARTGVSFGEVDRMVESEAGCSLAELHEREGAEGLAQRARRGLALALGRRPCGVVALEQLATDVGGLDRFADRARSVYVRRPASVLLERIRRQLASAPGTHPFQLGVPGCASDLDRFLAEREPALASADVVIEAGDRHPHALADELLASLDRITAVDRL